MEGTKCLFFSKAEEDDLINWYRGNKEILDAPLSIKNADAKKQSWTAITNKLNSKGITKRSQGEIKKKLQNMKLSVK